MLFTNEKDQGGNFKKQFLSSLRVASNLTVATGYFGASLIDELTPKLLTMSRRGLCRILVGMIYHGGVTKKQEDIIRNLDTELRTIDPNNGVYITRKEYHGKIYHIGDEIYLGSSNFSEQGFKSRWECTAKINHNTTRTKALAYLDFLFNESTTVKLAAVELREKTSKVSVKASKLLEDYKTETFPTSAIICELQIKLRVDNQPASSLNLFFDKGRKNQSGLYAPRPWYEVEITSSKSDRNDPCYPKSDLKSAGMNSRYGEFNAYIEEDGHYYKLKMTVASDFGKAIATSKKSGGRETLGRYVKGKLQAAGVLKIGERITSETLDTYGKDYITLKKIDDSNYILEF